MDIGVRAIEEALVNGLRFNSIFSHWCCPFVINLASTLYGFNTVTTGYIIPAGRLYGSYWSAYGFFCLPCPILFVIAASIIGPQTPLDLGRCDAYGLTSMDGYGEVVYLLYGSAGGRVITAAGGRSYNENSRFKRKVATGPQTPLDLGRCDAYGLVTSS
ncbi:hypothetical protein Tco_0072446 [Tanacetum coccineum]